MKSIVKRLYVFSSTLVILLGSTGCFYKEKDPVVHESGYFQYVIRRENSSREDPNDDSLIIVGFTELGEKQERIDVPRELDGHPVKRIGYQEDGAFHPRNDHYVTFPSTLKKMYVFDNIVQIAYLSGNVELMFCSEERIVCFGREESTLNQFIYKSIFNKVIVGSNTLHPANVVFMNNYPGEDDGGHYRLDNVEENETIPPVPDPVKEGYQFNGWYTEKECINEWNFDTVPTIAEGEEFDLYAGWTVK